jgi:hypothetical protein
MTRKLIPADEVSIAVHVTEIVQRSSPTARGIGNFQQLIRQAIRPVLAMFMKRFEELENERDELKRLVESLQERNE